MIGPLILSLTLVRPPHDTVTADSVIRELPAVMAFQVSVEQRDTLINGLFLARPPSTATLARVEADLPFALAWLLEGAPRYDRRRLLTQFGSDTAAMRRAFFDAIRHDRTFTTSLLRLAAPVLAAHGTVVSGVPSHNRTVLTRSQATALAARYFQVIRSNGKVGMSICAKPHLLRNRPTKRDDVVEAWFYSVVRPRGDWTDVSDVAFRLLKATEVAVGASASPQQLESAFWRRLENESRLWQRIRAEYRRTAAWAPVQLIE